MDVKNIENIIIPDTADDDDEDDIFRQCSLPKKMKMDGDRHSFSSTKSAAVSFIILLCQQL